MNVLFVTPEAVPFAKSGGLGDVSGSLPAAMNRLGAEVRVMMPLYKSIKEKYIDRLEFLTHFTCPLAWRNQYCGIFRSVHEGVTYYFLDNEQYFYREGYYAHYDDGERFAFFCRAVLESLKYLDFRPEILHCSEWQSALVPVFLKSHYHQDGLYQGLRTVFTIHNIEYQGVYGKDMAEDVLGLPQWAVDFLEWKGSLNYMKGAVVSCDRLTTVSPSYAEEITYSFYAHGLQDIIRENAYKLSGILNGIDQQHYVPAGDKAAVKRMLQNELGLQEAEGIPVIGMVGRMVGHKGLDLVERVFDELMGWQVQLVILGSGERHFEDFFRSKESAYPGKLAVRIGFSEDLAKMIYSGADLFLMPSVSEPCGLAQMIALRYGTPPIVRFTGGLRNTIFPFNPETGQGNGIGFCSINAHDMLGAVGRALEIFHNKHLWQQLKENALASDYSWRESAKKYLELYQGLL